MTDLFAVLAYGPDQAKLTTALSTAVILAERRSIGITIVVPALKHVEGSILSKVLGEDYVKNLVKKRSALIGNIPVRIESAITLNCYLARGVLLVLWPSEKMLTLIERCNLVSAAVVLSWIDKEIQPWLEKNNVIVVDEGVAG